MKLDDDSNILLKDFPERLEQEELFRLLAENISISWAKNESKAIRKNVLQTLQQDWFYISSYVHPLYDILYDTLYQAFRYHHQDNTIPLLKITKEWYEKANVRGYRPPFTNDFNINGFSIIGVSGVGKTYCTKKILRKCFDQLIKRENTIQITYLITNCVNIGSLKELLVKFLNEVDRLIGTQYVSDYVIAKNTTEKLEAIVANVGVRHYIGIWIIDEIHHLKSIPFRSAEQIINFLKNVSAAIGMPIVYVGTPEIKSILGGNFQIARRAEGNGSIFWERFTNENIDDQNDTQVNGLVESEWTLLLASLWKRHVLKNNGKLSKELIDAYYSRSQGIMSRLIAIHIRAQIIAMDSNEERITPEIIYETDKYFQFTNNMISALASGKEELISEYSDLSMRALNVIDEASTRKLSVKEIVELVLNHGFNKEEGIMIFKALFKGNVEFDNPKKGTNKTESDLDQQPSSKLSQNEPKPSGDVLDNVPNSTGADEVYESLKGTGIIGLDGKIDNS